MENKSAHVGKMEKRLEKWGAKLDELAARAGEVGAEAKAEYHKHLDDLKEQHVAIRVKLDELKTASGREWESFKSGVEGAGKELETAFKRMTE